MYIDSDWHWSLDGSSDWNSVEEVFSVSQLPQDKEKELVSEFTNEAEDTITRLRQKSLDQGKILLERDSESTGFNFNEYIQLTDLDVDNARLRFNLYPEGRLDNIKKLTYAADTRRIEKNVMESFGSGYTFTLTNVTNPPYMFDSSANVENYITVVKP